MFSRFSDLDRRGFLKLASCASGVAAWSGGASAEVPAPWRSESSLSKLPKGSAPAPVKAPHFPDRLHTFVWRNWSLVPVATLARVVGASREDILQIGKSMGLPPQPRISRSRQRRSYITVIRRNWHLLPYSQLLELLDWTEEAMAYTLREDDFLYVKLGNLKPQCEPLRFEPPSPQILEAAAHISRVIGDEFPHGVHPEQEPLFEFVRELSRPPRRTRGSSNLRVDRPLGPRFCYSYFALYGDPLLEPEADPYPDGYLARLAGSGVNGVWLQAVLFKLAPFPWESPEPPRHEQRLRKLAQLVTRARKHGIGIYLYLNEPRSMPLPFFEKHPDLKGVVEGDHAALCTSVPQVKEYLRQAVQHICRAVPDLAGFFTISASENLSNCWSHHGGARCPRCSTRSPSSVVAEFHQQILQGIQASGSKARLIAWDWGWPEEWTQKILDQLPREVSLMSVSEWDLPIRRGGVATTVGEYSISAVGPGPRATRHWAAARERGHSAIAKIQAGTTWELSAVPYLPALANVARHAVGLRSAGVEGLMLGWTLGGYPSPNLEVVNELLASPDLSESAALNLVAERRFGPSLAQPVVEAWTQCSTALNEFPYHGGVVYSAPLQMGPANPLWSDPTGYASSMVGFPYDHLDGWRAVYPAEVFIEQFEKVANGFEMALATLRRAAQAQTPAEEFRRMLQREQSVMEAAMLHFRSVALQSRFVHDRQSLREGSDRDRNALLLDRLEKTVRRELEGAKRLFELQSRDSRLGFEATNHYFFVPLDLMEKVINCRDLLDRWLPEERKRRLG